MNKVFTSIFVIPWPNERQNFAKDIIRTHEEVLKKKEEERKGRIQIKEEGKGKFSEGESMILFPSLSPPTSHFRRSRN